MPLDAGFSPRRAVAIRDVLSRTLDRLGLVKRLKETEAVRLFAQVAGEKISAKAQAVKMESGKLFVSVPSAAWRQELNYSKLELIDSLNEALGENMVKDIQFTA